MESASGRSLNPQRPGSPRLGSSTLTTSAPNQASASVQDGPASNWVRSSTLMPLSAGWIPVAVSGCLTCSCMTNPPDKELPLNGAAVQCVTRSALPGEFLRLPGRSLRDHDVHQRRTVKFHRLLKGAADIFRILDKESLAAEGLHHPVIAGAINQRVGLQIEHRVVGD